MVKRCITFICAILCVYAYAQEQRSEIVIDFRVNKTHIDFSYKNNDAKIAELNSLLQHVQEDSTLSIVNISVCGAASPEGSYQWNKQLANARMQTLVDIIRSNIDIPDSIITYDDSYIPWQQLSEQIAQSSLSRKDEILEILDDEPLLVQFYDDLTIDNRVIRLKRLGRKLWRRLLREYFGPMRNACAVFVTFKREPKNNIILPEPLINEMEIPADSVKVIEPVIDSILQPIPAQEMWGSKLYIKSNTIGLGLAIANAAVEIDLCQHWSINLPVYYSAWDYLKSTVKFRTLAVQPEIRYWFSENALFNDGWFAGAHFGLAYYNIAIDKEFRTQDHNGTSPALGGGLAIGYRMPISKNNRWKLEFSIGAGAYKLHYDKFHNHANGLLVKTEKKTYIGIDQASISIAYTIDLNNKVKMQ